MYYAYPVVTFLLTIVVMLLIFLAGAGIWFVPKGQVNAPRVIIDVIGWVRLAISIGTLIYLAAVYGLNNVDENGILPVLPQKFAVAAIVTAPGLILTGLALVLLAPRGRRGYALRMFTAGPKFIGPITCIVGTIIIGIGCLLAGDFFNATDRAVHLNQDTWILFKVLSSFLLVVLGDLPAFVVGVSLAALVVFNLFYAGDAHPLLPALVGPWFVIGAVGADLLSQAVGQQADLVVVPSPVNIAIKAISVATAVALSAWEFRIVKNDLGVTLRTGPPDLVWGDSGKADWVPLAGGSGPGQSQLSHATPAAGNGSVEIW